MTKKRLQKASTCFSYLWLLSVIAFSAIIAYTTKFITNDPNFSPGGNEHIWLIPMLSSVGIGGLSFILMVIFGIAGKVKKTEDKYHPPFKISTWVSSILVFLIFSGWALILFGVRQSNLGYKSQQVSYTGQQLFDAVDRHRQENGKPKLTLNERVCDNLVERHRVISSGDVGHEGFENWAKEEGLTQEGYSLGELYVKYTSTVDDAISYWSGSPGHRLTLLNESFTDGCAYAGDNTAVVVLATKKYFPEEE